MSELSLQRFTSRLSVSPPPARRLGQRRAAVAAVLRFDRDAAELLLMRRAERAGDRWSGQVSLPGGREEAADADLVSTAIRETREELGIDLATAALLGTLPSSHAIARGKLLPMTITPFVFHLAAPQPIRLGPEAEASFWLPLDPAARGELDADYQYQLGPFSRRFPSFRHQGEVVWGLTYQILQSLLRQVR
ncbi:MAG: CoA pyrophosphatase [Deltaproteobacteria bacterium]|nr:CoA pyrophosphatase [Deltaproteobacteria bacterium]